jgi:CRP-like cAMP-binding protein
MEMYNMPEALSRFRKKIESFAPVSDDDFLHLAHIMHEKHFSKGEVILKERQVCKEYYFILNGCIRSFGLEDGKEVNVKFFFEDDTACDFVSFRNQEPSKFYLIAMEDSVVYYATKAEAMQVFDNAASLQTLLFRFFQQLFFNEEQDSNNFKLMSPTDRYQFLIEHKPQYLQRISVLHLASYLGISRETLTRIRQGM